MNDTEWIEAWHEYNDNNLPLSFADFCYKQGRADEMTIKLDSYNQDVLQRFCLCCSQEPCDGGMIGSIQECATVRTLRDVLDDVANEYKE